jgi:HTH-type transcriptional regulator/antitoxin HigA
MDQSGMTVKDLVPYIVSLNRVYEVLSYKRALSLNMIRRLSAGLGIPAEALIRESEALAA